MLDTVALLIPKEDFQISYYDAFTPSAKGLYEVPFYKGACIKCIQCPTKSDIRTGIYKPKLTLIKRVVNGGYSIGLKVEFSVTKLLFGNNFEELENTDFEAVLLKLQEILATMGVLIEVETLQNAKVCCVHFGKNVILDEAPSNLIINTIRKLNISKRLDAGNTDYRNDGQAIRFHANSYELTFYDKVKDLEQSKISEKRAIECDNEFNFDFFNVAELACKEVLRMEVRLNTARKLKEVLAKVGYELTSPTFSDIFNKELAKQVLMYFWNICIKPSLPTLILAEQTAHDIYYQAKSIGMNDYKALQVVGALNMIKAEGFRPLRNALSNHSYYRVKAEFDKFEQTGSYLYDVFKQIRRDLVEMQSLRFNET